MPVEAVGYRDGAVELIDQTRLPGEHVVLRVEDLDTLCEAIRSLRVRGAPAICIRRSMRFCVAGWVEKRLSRPRPERGLIIMSCPVSG